MNTNKKKTFEDKEFDGWISDYEPEDEHPIVIEAKDGVILIVMRPDGEVFHVGQNIKHIGVIKSFHFDSTWSGEMYVTIEDHGSWAISVL